MTFKTHVCGAFFNLDRQWTQNIIGLFSKLCDWLYLFQEYQAHKTHVNEKETHCNTNIHSNANRWKISC